MQIHKIRHDKSEITIKKINTEELLKRIGNYFAQPKTYKIMDKFTGEFY